MELSDELDRRAERRPFGRLVVAYMRAAALKNSEGYNSGRELFRMPRDPAFNAVRGGFFMEKVDEALKLTAEELKTSEATLEEVVNRMSALIQVLSPQLQRQIQEVRATRMAVETDCRTLLSALAEVRNFFMGKEYDTELQRVERMVALCKDLRQLRDDGTLDAITDAILKLSGVER